MPKEVKITVTCDFGLDKNPTHQETLVREIEISDSLTPEFTFSEMDFFSIKIKNLNYDKTKNIYIHTETNTPCLVPWKNSTDPDFHQEKEAYLQALKGFGWQKI